MVELTQEYLLERFEYRDGELFYRYKPGSKMMVGDKVGARRKDGYITVSINYKRYFAHRLIFLMHHGYLPITIDHIDRNPSNNCIENLRAATHFVNGANHKTRSDSTSKVKGVTWDKANKQWCAAFTFNDKNYWVGRFYSLEDAKECIELARELVCGEFANHGQDCVIAREPAPHQPLESHPQT